MNLIWAIPTISSFPLYIIELAKNQHEHSKGEHENSDELGVKFSAARGLFEQGHLFAADDDAGDRLTELNCKTSGRGGAAGVYNDRGEKLRKKGRC